ncbi:hypothetical protein GUITHDRAFT_143813 [Guillardia theta CCMP2712]|uniref:Uncharacterized protein n=1 Tax=Guillardia theta (strain CCMP2712) TaxID=905079 RepID=L1ISD1_GUITC|nr:hypothetical protein GUITHDRAFT_143813 [Guillardia theta CCMP2712]EKX39007.1 hypothetical protein GUITHDRAFT_143813 [Guillardia theta CCMP2712]|eukprot:XP_005825987.1 hypothetical protein GUITHDRAFT_143813 [Guillardia theta CCMP2712]
MSARLDSIQKQERAARNRARIKEENMSRVKLGTRLWEERLYAIKTSQLSLEEQGIPSQQSPSTPKSPSHKTLENLSPTLSLRNVMESGMEIEQFKALVGNVEEEMIRLNSQASALEAQTNLSNQLAQTIDEMRKEIAQELQCERQRSHQLLLQNSELSSKLIRSKVENESIKTSVRKSPKSFLYSLTFEAFQTWKTLRRQRLFFHDCRRRVERIREHFDQILLSDVLHSWHDSTPSNTSNIQILKEKIQSLQAQVKDLYRALIVHAKPRSRQKSTLQGELAEATNRLERTTKELWEVKGQTAEELTVEEVKKSRIFELKYLELEERCRCIAAEEHPSLKGLQMDEEKMTGERGGEGLRMQQDSDDTVKLMERDEQQGAISPVSSDSIFDI